MQLLLYCIRARSLAAWSEINFCLTFVTDNPPAGGCGCGRDHHCCTGQGVPVWTKEVSSNTQGQRHQVPTQAGG